MGLRFEVGWSFWECNLASGSGVVAEGVQEFGIGLGLKASTSSAPAGVFVRPDTTWGPLDLNLVAESLLGFHAWCTCCNCNVVTVVVQRRAGGRILSE